MLGGWMAEYIRELAGLVQRAEQADDRAKAEAALAREVRALWRHRSSFPSDRPPLGRYDAVAAVLEHLDTEKAQFLRYARVDRSALEAATDPDIAELLEAVVAIDDLSRELTRALIVEAAERTAVREEGWLQAARVLGDTHTIENLLRESLRPKHVGRRYRDTLAAVPTAAEQAARAIGLLKRLRTALADRRDDPNDEARPGPRPPDGESPTN